MSTLTEIEAALPKLTDTELKQLAADVDQLYRERKGALLYQDSYGNMTDADLIVSADRAFQEYDKDETPEVKRKQLAEVMRRREEILSGKAQGVSLAQAVREIQALVP